MEMDKLTMEEWHKKQAINNFNYTWDLIDKNDRTKEDDLEMINAAHTSCFHWSKIGTPLNVLRGEWQISRVYSLLNMGDVALYHGKYSLELCENNGIGDFDLAFAYEAIARAHMVNKNLDEMNTYLELAKSTAENIAKEEDKDYFLSELNSISL